MDINFGPVGYFFKQGIYTFFFFTILMLQTDPICNIIKQGITSINYNLFLFPSLIRGVHHTLQIFYYNYFTFYLI